MWMFSPCNFFEMDLTLEKLQQIFGKGTHRDHEREIVEIQKRTGKPVKKIRTPKRLVKHLRLR